MKRLTLPLIYAGSMLTLLLLLGACGSEQQASAPLLRPVVYEEVQYGGATALREFNGTAQTDLVINLSFRSSGIITLFDMALGQRVRKGQLLARLDNVAARLAYEQALASLRSAESQMKTSELNYDRVRSLYEKGSASLSNFENAKNAFQNALSGFESAQRSVQIQQEQINYGLIRASANGVIASVSAEVDENVSPGQVVAVLNAGDEMVIDLGVPEGVINDLRLNMPVRILFPALADQDYKGTISEISPAVNPATSTYPVKISIDEESSDIKAGMAATVAIDLNTVSDQYLIVPAKSVGEDSQGRFVFIVSESTEEAVVKKQYIQLGDLTTAGFEVVNGLQEGSKIATAGLQSLLDGQKVRVK
ncbi:MAG: efflux RND transporter periplasmic adaptor subunit [Bacteroidota bacterium]